MKLIIAILLVTGIVSCSTTTSTVDLSRKKVRAQRLNYIGVSCGITQSMFVDTIYRANDTITVNGADYVITN